MGKGRLEDALRVRIARIVEEYALPDACKLALQDAVVSVEREFPFSEDLPGLSQPEELPTPSISLEPPGFPGEEGDLRPVSGEVVRSRRVARYEDMGVIGAGGMGEVRKVLDRDLNRTMAMKVLRTSMVANAGVTARFIEEAQVTAQLQHPGIIPVHELGRMLDGRFYFTMKEVRGKTLRAVIQEVHHASPGSRWEAAPSGWTFRRLIEAFRKVVEAVAYAHSRNVVHRDLKPANIMVGDFGEVLVMDWGLAKVMGHPSAQRPEEEIVITDRSLDTRLATQMGTVTGTPGYMPPEQARGDVHRLGPASDVYSLGAILYEILSGRPPYDGPDAMMVLVQVISGPPPPPGRRAPEVIGGETLVTDSYADELPSITAPHGGPALEGPPLPAELVEICNRAMEREPDDRYPDASALAAAIDAWLDGSHRREQALKVLSDAVGIRPEIADLRARAETLRAEALRLLEHVKSFEPIERKLPGWHLEDEARRLERLADLKDVEFLQRVQGSLTHDPHLPEAHAELADYYHAQHLAAERLREPRAEGLEVLLRAYDRGRYAAYLKGEGALTLVTDPPGAEVDLYRYEEVNRKQVARFVRSLGVTPLKSVSLPMGSYLLRLRAHGRAEVNYPVLIGRQEHWDGRRPGDNRSFPIHLPLQDELGPDDVYVPAGWYISGGDHQAHNALPWRRIWLDAFVIRRFPITNREYIAFLDDLVERGLEAEALRWAPRKRVGSMGQEGAVIYGRDETGHFVLVPDTEGDVWGQDWPAIQVDWHCAMAYCRWAAERSGMGWRLPGEIEWEKASRGVDGRFFPWGDFPEPTRACVLDAHAGKSMPCDVGLFPEDASPYDVRGMAGNVRDWCLDIYRPGGPDIGEGRVATRPEELLEPSAPRVARGGAWGTRLGLNSRVAGRYWDLPILRATLVGFRIARPYEPPSRR